ncbi:MAG: hypothetical protein KDA71_24575 [Planctomycetales bacterium]|nr:hypothetical protein [Planctomycetales bacterium]
MQLNCRSCGRDIPAEDINVNLAIAKCSSCHSVFNFLDQLGTTAAMAAVRQRPAVEMPKAMQVEDWGAELVITRRWFTWAAIFLVFFCLFWDGFLVVWYTAAISSKQILMLVFPLIHVAVGVFLTYLTLSMFVNKTVIRVANGELSVRHGPLPWPGKRNLLTHEIQQLYVTEQMRRTKRGYSYTYHLNAKLAQGNVVKLLSNLETPDHGLFIEQKLEQHLKIEDEAVAGEVTR